MTITKKTDLPVSPDEAFALVTDPERLRRWKAVSAYVDLRAGGAYRFTIVPGQTAAGTYREVEPGRRLVFGWGWEGDVGLPPDGSTVVITIEPVDGGSRVTLVHEGLDPDQEARHSEGWDHFLDRLARVATTGDAGADEWAWAPGQLDPAIAADAVLAALQPVLRGITDDDRDNPTPCADFTCDDLVVHLAASVVQVGSMAGVDIADDVGGSIENRLSVLSARAIDAWRARGTDGTVSGPGGQPMPADLLASLLPLELALHGWDLARASHQTLRLSDEVVAYLRVLAEAVVPGGRGRSFGPEVAPAPDAGPLDRLAAYAGRESVEVSAKEARR
jgi:uncharacterized protein (TIGR03086 family)